MNKYDQCKEIFQKLMTISDIAPFLLPLSKNLDDEKYKSNIKYLNSLYKELLVISRDFPNIITEDFIRSIGGEVVVDHKMVAKLLKNGIKNDDQFRFLLDYIDRLLSEQTKTDSKELISKINNCLAIYQNMKKLSITRRLNTKKGASKKGPKKDGITN